MKKQLAFVLSGGGARGALQVGALRALLEAGIRPDLLVGTSVGAVNATFLAVHGLTLEGLQGLVEAWHDARLLELLPPNYLWLTLRALFNRPVEYFSQRMREFFLAHGLTPEGRFGDIQGVRLIMVAADLISGRPVLYGLEASQSILEGLLASTAIPPWVTPLQKEGQLLVDGGAVSCVPIEPALTLNATEIIALDLLDPRIILPGQHKYGLYVGRFLYTVEQRQFDLELALAAAQGVPVRHIPLRGEQPVPLWDFNHTEALIEQGYAIARREIAAWRLERRSGARLWFDQIWSRIRLSKFAQQSKELRNGDKIEVEK